jgi:DNA-binding response OmpR family regulator
VITLNEKIFIVEDDEKIVRMTAEYFESWGMIARGVEDFSNVLGEATAFQPDLILMDITLPSFNGYYFTQEIRKTSTVPIIFISSKNEEMDMVMAMNMGADDFVTKPFSLTVLFAKVQALLRRTYSFQEKQNSLALTFKEYTLDFEEGTVARADAEKIHLSQTELRILFLLFEHKENLVTREQIMEKLWENENFIDANTLAVNMTRLRKKLLDIDLSQYIHTVKGKGFVLSENF